VAQSEDESVLIGLTLASRLPHAGGEWRTSQATEVHGPKDFNQIGFEAIQQDTGQMPKPKPPAEKNPAAVTLGRLGGLKGGRARAEKLSAADKKAIATKAAAARWTPKS
jgi:hypothetical protein